MTGAGRQALNDRLIALRTLRREAESRAQFAVKSDINVTPLVDVVLVLLIIFMVVTPLIASGVAVDLPRTVHHLRKPDDGKDIIVSVTRQSVVYVGVKRLPRAEDVGRSVLAEKRKYPEKSVFLKGDARATYGTLRRVMEALHQADIDDVTLGTEELMKQADQ